MKILEIIVPLVLIVILLACMMNKEDDGFSVGGDSHSKCGSGKVQPSSSPDGAFTVGGSDDVDAFTVGCSACQRGEGFNVGGEADKTCKVTMIWADWCGFSRKAKPEWDSLVSEMNGQSVNGYKLDLSDAEEKKDPETVNKYKPDGFPSYFVELSDKPGQKDDFNSIKKDDMMSKIKASITKMIGGVEEEVAPPKPVAPHKPAQPTRPTKVGKPTVHGEIFYKDCNEAYGPVNLQSVSYNILHSTSAPNVVGGVDCTDLDYAPIKVALGGSQVPHIGNIPALGQLQAPGVDAVQGTIRPNSLQKAQQHSPDKKADVTMVWADWCGYSNKAKPEWDKLKSRMNGKTVSGCKVDMHDLEHKKNEKEIKEKYSDVKGFPTYVVEVSDSSGKLIKKQSFNSIEENDMQQKLETILSSI